MKRRLGAIVLALSISACGVDNENVAELSPVGAADEALEQGCFEAAPWALWRGGALMTGTQLITVPYKTAGCSGAVVELNGLHTVHRVAGNPPIARRSSCLGDIQNDNVCCPKSCGSCGGTGCGSRPGGAANCCTGTIRSANESCEDKDPNDADYAPCVVPDEWMEPLANIAVFQSPNFWPRSILNNEAACLAVRRHVDVWELNGDGSWSLVDQAVDAGTFFNGACRLGDYQYHPDDQAGTYRVAVRVKSGSTYLPASVNSY